MKLATISKITLGILLAYGAAAQAADVAGRVLIAVGDTSALRNGQEVKLAVGAAVESGDTLRVGDASNMQVRFTDAAVMALRPNTIFRVDEYAFTNKAESDKSVFALLKGGIRTITGLIGRNSRANYAVKTDTSTIGIRGTHYTLVSCADSCRNPDGGLAPNGTYGGVTDGRIVNVNQAGEREFGKDEYFYVASATSLPQPLLAPPSFLRDRLEGQAKSPGKGTTAAGKEATARGEGGNTNVSSSPQPVAEVPTAVSETHVATAASEQPAVVQQATGGGTAVVTPPAVLGGDGKALTATTGVTLAEAVSQFGSTSPFHGAYIRGDAGVTITWDSVGLKRMDCGSNCYIDRDTGTVVELGADAGTISYGRWVGGPILAGGWGQGLNFTADNSGMGYVAGVTATNLPTSGSYSYSFLGATRPTFSDGIGAGLGQGSVTTGTFGVDFVARTVKASLSLLFTGGNSSYGIVMPSAALAGSQFTGSGTMVFNSGAKNVCSSGGCSAQFAGFLAGSGATHAGLGYDVTAADGTTPFYIDGVAAFKYVPSAPATTYNLAGVSAWANSTTTNASSDVFASTMTAAQLASAVVANPALMTHNFGSGEIPASSITDTGTNAAAGNVFWGVTSGSGYPVTGLHGAFGDAVTNQPTSGVVTYSQVGGTHPRDSLGGTGTWTSGSVLSINFTSKLVSTVGSWNWSVSGRNYSLAFANLPYDTDTYQAVAGSGTNGYPLNPPGSTFAVTGTSGAVTGYGVWINGKFTGAGAAGGILGIASQHSESGIGNVGTASAQVFGKNSSSGSSSSAGCTTYPCSHSDTYVMAGVSNSTSTSSTATGSVTSNDKYSWASSYQYDTTYNFASTSSGTGTTTGPTVVSSTYTTGPLLDQGSDAAAGNLTWSRVYNQSSTTYSDGSSYSNNIWQHEIRGDRPTAIPTSGSYTFSHVGGTSPTDQNGIVGTVTSGGSWSVDFATRTVATVTPVNWNVNNVSYSLSVPSQVMTTTTYPTFTAADGSYTSTSTVVTPITNINLSCSPNCTPNSNGSMVAPGFFGSNAQGLGVGYSTSANVGGTNQYTAHVQAYKR